MAKFLLVLLLAVIGIRSGAQTTEKIKLEFFSQPGCQTCSQIKNFLLPELRERYPDKFSWIEYDIGQKENFLRLLAVLERLKIDSNETAHLVINQSILLAGPQIEDQLFTVMEQVSTAKPGTSRTSSSEPTDQQTLLLRRAAGFSIGAVAIAGLIDGINPCVFSALVFFISLLSVAKVKREKLLLSGLTYCAACFITYLLLGCGLFYFIQLLSGFSVMRKVIDYGMIAMLVIFAGISLGDAYRFYHGRGKAGVWMKLPDSLSNRIHRIMKHGIAYRILLPGIFLTGVLVTLLESVCTGQVYVPTLVLMARETVGMKWIFLLLLYNLMFILPLLIIFWIVYRGVNTMQLVNWSKRHLVWSKCLLAALFIGLAVLILVLS